MYNALRIHCVCVCLHALGLYGRVFGFVSHRIVVFLFAVGFFYFDIIYFLAASLFVCSWLLPSHFSYFHESFFSRNLEISIISTSSTPHSVFLVPFKGCFFRRMLAYFVYFMLIYSSDVFSAFLALFLFDDISRLRSLYHCNLQLEFRFEQFLLYRTINFFLVRDDSWE